MSLPVNHPQAGYVGHDRSASIGTGTLPPDEQDLVDERDQADEEAAEAVAKNEEEVAAAEAKAAEEAAKAEQTEAPSKTAAKTPAKESSSS